jgi:OmpA-OmpF porin, OOP family
VIARAEFVFGFVAALVVGTATGCGGVADERAVVEDVTVSQSPDTTAAPTPASAVIRPVLPVIAPVAAPDVSLLNATGDVVAESLGVLASPAAGIDVVGATCAQAGGALQYSGSTGTDVFDIEVDGSGTFIDDSGGGLTTVEVGADGSGNFYDDTAAGLLTISVGPDRSGEYYSEQPGELVTIDVDADGSGTYYDKRDERLLTVTLNADGSGRLFDETATRLTTVDAAGDGSGKFYRKTADRIVTVEMDVDGGWEFVDTAPSRVATLDVEPDGSGSYDEAGMTSLEFDFDTEGRGPDGERIEMPPPPEFLVAAGFAPLGKLGSLAPPCATVIRLDSQVLFDFNEAVLKPEAGPVLAEVVTVLAKSDKPIEIVGHTDSIGSDEYNLALSLERASAVEAALRQRGLTVDIVVDGRGESEPIAPNALPDGTDDPAGRAQNRRVEIAIRD